MAFLFSLFLLVSVWAQDTTLIETTSTTSTTTTLVPNAPSDGTTKTATFTSGLTGTIVATQTTDGTKFTVNLAYPNATTATSSHKYHIHDTEKDPCPCDGDAANCDDNDVHYDPYDLDGANYNCDPSTPSTCYSGDLSGKFGALDIPTPVNSVTYTDGTINVNELENRGVVVHVAQLGAGRLACASFTSSASVNADGSLAINSAESNAGGVFLMWLVFLLAIGYCTYALWNIGTSEAKEHDKAVLGKLSRSLSSRFGSLDGLDKEDPMPEKKGPPIVPGRNPFNEAPSEAPSAPSNPFTSEPNEALPVGRQERIDTTSTVATAFNPTYVPDAPPPSGDMRPVNTESRPLPSRPGRPAPPLPRKAAQSSSMATPPVPNRHPSTASPPELPKREPPTPPVKREAESTSEFVDVEVNDEGETQNRDDFQPVDIGQDIHY